MCNQIRTFLFHKELCFQNLFSNCHIIKITLQGAFVKKHERVGHGDGN